MTVNIEITGGSLHDKIVLWGMSCSGKTTFGKLLDRYQYCFDAMFPWRLIESMDFSSKEALKHVARSCTETKFVLDGWHLSDPECDLIDAEVYVIYGDYSIIIGQYRVPVTNYQEHQSMYDKWYCRLPKKASRFFRNNGSFVETSMDECLESIKDQRDSFQSRN